MSQLRGRFFANSDVLLTTALPVHNAALAGDELTTIQLNREWRKIVASALQFYWRHGKTSLALDNEDALDDLLEDLYNAETFVSRKFKIGNIDLVSNKTTTSTTGVIVAGTSVTWTPTYKNWKIRYWNIDITNSTAGQSVHVYIGISGVSLGGSSAAEGAGANRRDLECEAVYLNQDVGVAKTVDLYWNVTGGTGTMNAGSILGYEIEEWE